MQAIETKYLGATNTRGSRIKAQCSRGSISISLPYELNDDERHAFAAQRLVEKFIEQDFKLYGTPKDKNPWSNSRVKGTLKNNNHVHVYV